MTCLRRRRASCLCCFCKMQRRGKKNCRRPLAAREATRCLGSDLGCAAAHGSRRASLSRNLQAVRRISLMCQSRRLDRDRATSGLPPNRTSRCIALNDAYGPQAVVQRSGAIGAKRTFILGERWHRATGGSDNRPAEIAFKACRTAPISTNQRRPAPRGVADWSVGIPSGGRYSGCRLNDR
jgi:hypothetical protein